MNNKTTGSKKVKKANADKMLAWLKAEVEAGKTKKLITYPVAYRGEVIYVTIPESEGK